MTQIAYIITLTLIAGACIPAGGAIAHFTQLRPYWLEGELRHFIIALGGGILLGAVILVLIPEGIRAMENSAAAIPIFISGGLVFFILERQLGLKRREAPQLTGMLLDFIPESVALGGLITMGAPTAPLLALLIGLQNLPEGFNAYRELIALTDHSAKRTLMVMLILVFVGPAAGLFGFFFLSDHHSILGATMLFSSGGILYLIFQDIAPQSHLDRHWAPPVGAVIGVGVTLIGRQLLV